MDGLRPVTATTASLTVAACHHLHHHFSAPSCTSRLVCSVRLYHEARRDLAVRTSRAVVLSVDPRAAGITQHHSVILALCKPATAVATTRTLHYPSHSSRRRRGNPWSQVSRRPPATTHPLQKTDSIDRLPRLAGLSARGGLALPLAPRCGRARSEPYCACARSGRCTEPLVPGLHMSVLPCERSVD